MISSRVLLGASVGVIATALSAPAIVSSRSRATDGPRLIPATRSGVAESADETAQPDSAGFLGVVVALQSVELSARFEGTLERLDVQVGDHVKGGTTIARLDSRSVAQDLEIAEAALRVADAEHDRLAIELQEASDRRARLHSISELVPREQLALAVSQEEMAAARLRGAVADGAGKRARASQLRQMLSDARIVAPFDGTIATVHVNAGASVSRSTPIVRVISPASLVVRFAVPEDQATALRLGRHVRVRVESVNLTADGVIENIVPEIDAALRMVVIEARLSETGGPVDTAPAGAIARVVVPVDGRAHDDGAPIDAPHISARSRSTGHEPAIH